MIDRYEEGAGLTDRSRRPHSGPHETPQALVDGILEARRHHPRWGAKKLLRIPRRKDPRATWPARTTVCDLLKRHDLIPKTRRRPRLSHPGRPLTAMTESNGIWTADFKGQFKTRDGVSCYPLTLVDGYSRYLLAGQGLRSTTIVLARPIFRRAFEEYGLPHIIRSDNGVPFATTALGRLSLLSVVDSARHLPGIDPTRPSRTERATRADAPHVEGGDHQATVRESAGPTDAVQSVPRRI